MFIDKKGRYYEGDRQSDDDKVVDRKPSDASIYDGTGWVTDLNAVRLSQISIIKSGFDAAVNSPVTSSALGAPHTYSNSLESRSFLNNLLALNVAGKFTCINQAGIKPRRDHTKAQLLQVAQDIYTAIEAKFVQFEALENQVNAAPNETLIKAITWPAP